MSAMTDESTSLARIGRVMRDNPLLPLGLLLALLVGALEILQPGIVKLPWIANTIRFAIPLAMLAACQTLTMLTGGIDLSAGILATVAAYLTATLVPLIGAPASIALSPAITVTLGLLNGIGIAFYRVHPLIMTLGTGLIASGFMQVYQRYVIATGIGIPDLLLWLGIGRTFGLPNGLFLFLPFAVLIVWAQKRTGFGRLLFAMGSNEGAARLSGVRAWQVILALYALSGLIAGITGLLYLGIVKTPKLTLVTPLLLPSVAAAVVGGTSIFGGRGGYGGTILGALILTVLGTMLTLLHMPEGGRRILFGLIVLGVTALFTRITENS